MAVEHESSMLVSAVALLGAAVIAVPLFRRLGLGSVLGYVAAGLLIGPFGFGWFADPQAILHFAELGVVMFLFIIGLEMRPSHLWQLRRQIFGLGSLQIIACTLGLTGVGLALGFSPVVSFIGGAGFVLTSTAIVMQMLAERGDIALPHGQKMVSVLLFEDLLIVPLLALVSFLSPTIVAETSTPHWVAMLTGIASLAGLIAAGVWLLNPLFSILAMTRTREVMVAAALLVVLGSALLMEMGGLSMAMGAFLAGVLLSESTFRHELEADVEPFRGLLLGLFFLAVGMSLNLSVVADNWVLIAMAVPAMMLTKALCIYLIARLTHSPHREALDRAVLMAQGGEFAFVLYGAAATGGLIDDTVNANFTAIVVISMVLTPLVVIVVRRFMAPERASMEGIPIADGLDGSVLMIGFGRFGQVVSQALLARGVDVSIIDADIEMIRSAKQFGFTVYYGDGTRLDVLRTSGAGKARAIAICVDKQPTADRIAELIRAEFPQAKLLVRAFDRDHARKLVAAGVDYHVRETFESAMLFGGAALRLLGVPDSEADDVIATVRDRDTERFALEVAGGGYEAGMGMLLRNTPQATSRPTPFIKPRAEGKALNDLPADSAPEST
ncbi:monovalent cation:proton antiporter-2 (CPA2) family protein [Steroidobacter sp.]|uniref:monovalent cation:proton antiporter-2 (CPA2) family protein n=1 Tax=Steroidobacter sp. TaxID=1978227 RepID=UPI001A514269|nr:monovalent cation:proton antiporter-2 (CPA2) family protein [Steroidobacter sp.]MBL8267060.1 cation:proton antiporter [Steroidobacter sp.]